MPCDRYKDPDYKVKWARRYRSQNPEEAKEREHRYYQAQLRSGSKARAAAKAKERRLKIQNTKEYKENRRKEWMKYKYGITPEQYNAMHSAQDGLCAICDKEEITRWRRLAVDHDHNTGEVRGLLCFKCNMMLAYFEDSDWSRRASEYLNRKRG